MANEKLSPHVLRQFLRYEPETGKLFWLRHPKWTVQVSARLTGHEAITAVNMDDLVDIARAALAGGRG